MSLIGKFASVGGATLASRVLGFVREAMIAALLGAGPVADAFYAAFRFPNLFRRLFAEGAFNTAFVPLFARQLEAGGRTQARAFAEQVVSVLIAVLLLLTALALVFMPFLVASIIAPSFANDPAKFDLTVLLTRIMFPYLAAMSLVAMLSGILNSFRRYFLAALAPVILNLVFILVLLAGWWMGLDEAALGKTMAWGVVVAGVLQLSLLLFGTAKEGFSFRPRMPRITPAVKRLLVLAVPTAIAGGITQINLLVGQIIASAQDGAIAVMNYADRLMQLPLGIIGISIGVVLLPELTRALSGTDRQEAVKLQNRSLEFGLALTLPAATGLFMLPLVLVSLLYERGAFDRQTAEITAEILAAFAVGLPAFVLIKIFQPAFYAREDMRTPMWFSAANAIVNIGLSLMLFPLIGVVGLAVATSVAGWLNAALLGFALFASGDYYPDARTLKNTIYIVIASMLMAVFLWFANNQFGVFMLESSLLVRFVTVGLTIAMAAGIYGVIVVMSGAVPLSQLRAIMGRQGAG